MKNSVYTLIIKSRGSIKYVQVGLWYNKVINSPCYLVCEWNIHIIDEFQTVSDTRTTHHLSIKRSTNRPDTENRSGVNSGFPQISALIVNLFWFGFFRLIRLFLLWRKLYTNGKLLQNIWCALHITFKLHVNKIMLHVHIICHNTIMIEVLKFHRCEMDQTKPATKMAWGYVHVNVHSLSL